MAFQAYRRSSLWFVFLCLLSGVLHLANKFLRKWKTEKRSFDISEGYAINTLKEAAQQAGGGIYILRRLGQRCKDFFNTRRMYIPTRSIQSHVGGDLARRFSTRAIRHLCHHDGL